MTKFIPIDHHAKDGQFFLVRTANQHQHCARWTGGLFAYGSGQRVQGEVIAYVWHPPRPIETLHVEQPACRFGRIRG